MSQPITVDIISDDDDTTIRSGRGVRFELPNTRNKDAIVVDISTPAASYHSKKKPRINSDLSSTPVFIIDDDPTPCKPYIGTTTSTSFVAETPFSEVSMVKRSKGSSSLKATPSMVEDTPTSKLSKSDASVVKCSKESPGDQTPSFVADTPMSDLSKPEVPLSKCNKGMSDPQLHLHSVSDAKSGISGLICLESENESENVSGFKATKKRETSALDVANELEWSTMFSESAFPLGNLNILQAPGDNSLSNSSDGETALAHGHPDTETESLEQITSVPGEKGKCKDNRIHNSNSDEGLRRKRTSKEDRLRLREEKKQQKEEEKLRKASERAQAAEIKKLEKEKQKWEKGKLALKSIVAEIDTRVVELGSVGGHLLTRFGEKGVSYRIKSNPIERSIVWTMTVPEHIAQISSDESEVRYVLLVYEAEEFCKLIISGSIMDHVSQVQRRYPYHTICYLTNRLMAYINKREQEQYKKATNCVGWRRPPIEEVLAKLTTHFTRVHTRQCIDEAELAEHVVGLTCSLASCQYRKKLTRLSVNANGSIVPKDSVDRNLIKKDLWLKALVAIPKVQPRFAIAIWKKYPTMRSLLSIYMDPSKSVHEKEFLLKDLITDGLLGDDRRLGEVCSKRVYRILMAESGNITTDDAENGADFFYRQPS